MASYMMWIFFILNFIIGGITCVVCRTVRFSLRVKMQLHFMCYMHWQ